MLAIVKRSWAVGAVAFSSVAFGGWAVVSVKDLPDYFVAGQQYTIQFQVRQHGTHLLGGLEPQLVVSSSERRLGGLVAGKDEITVPAVAQSGEGTYAATFTAPAAQRLFLTIKSGFRGSDLRLYPQTVVARGTAPTSLAEADRGRMLFVAKGCNTCHAADLADRPDNPQISVGPDLSGRRLARAFVIQKVKGPASQKMPDLGLSDAEANALATFLTGERTAAAGGGR